MSDSLREKIESDLREAIRSRDDTRLRALRGLKAALQAKELEKGRGSLTEETALAVLQKQAKQRKESIAQFETAGRTDLVQKENEELAILETYLPEQLTDKELEELVREAVDATGSASPADIGKVMGSVMQSVRGRADGNRVREIAARLLTS